MELWREESGKSENIRTIITFFIILATMAIWTIMLFSGHWLKKLAVAKRIPASQVPVLVWTSYAINCEQPGF